MADAPKYPADNPKDLVGQAKPPGHYMPDLVIAEIEVAMMEGALKYGAYNYMVAPIRASIYKAAANRHLNHQFWALGEDLDDESSLSHITKAIACLVVLRASMIQGTWIDDRPPRGPRAAWDRLKEVVAALRAKYPKPVAPFIQTEYPSAH